MAWRLGVVPGQRTLEWLRSALDLDEPVHVLGRCGGGVGASTHVLGSSDIRIVLKQYPTERSEAVQREWDGLQLAGKHGLRVPAPLAVDADGSVTGLSTIAMEFAPGEPDLRARDPERFVSEVAVLLASLHEIIPGRDLSLRAAERIQDWEPPAVVPEGLLPHDLISEVFSAAADMVPGAELEDPVVNHGDFHPGNLLWADGHISALLDWSHLRIGTRSTELAYFRVELAVLAGWDLADALADQYRERTGHRPRNQTVRDLLHVCAGHSWAHTWLEGWHEQGRTDLTIDDVATRLADIARILLGRA